MSKKADAREERKLDKETRQRKIAQLAKEPSIYDRTQFDSEKEAADWMYEVLAGEEFFDNYRFCYAEDDNAVRKYEQQRYEGCCGSVDYDIFVRGQPAKIGCNFGH